MLIISSPPNDSFTKRLFYKLTHKFSDQADILYLWSASLEPNYIRITVTDAESEFLMTSETNIRELLKNSMHKDIIILGVKDHLTSGVGNPYERPLLAEYLYDMFNYYHNKKFILFTSLENLSYYIDNDNVSIVPWGGDITNQSLEYKNIEPIIEKNLDSQKTFICLNRHLRSHRFINVCNLYGLSLDQYGLISFLHKDQLPTTVEFDKVNDSKLRTILMQGLGIFSHKDPSIQDDPNIYERPNDNVSNFKFRLSQNYRNVFVEIITETSGFEKCFLITEKTTNSIIACNFPIWISSPGVVKFLRSMGLDVFDDIIDHSYDTIEDPYLRFYQAVFLNRDLLTNTEATKYLWKKNKDRFLKNVEFAKNDMYNFYQVRTEQIFNSLWNSKYELQK